MTTVFGCPREAMDRIAAALRMSNEQLARSGLDLDVLDCARWLVEDGIKAETPEQVRASGIPPVVHLADEYPGFLDAVVIAAKNLHIEAEDWVEPQVDGGF
jgi:hypothetical protein